MNKKKILNYVFWTGFILVVAYSEKSYTTVWVIAAAIWIPWAVVRFVRWAYFQVRKTLFSKAYKDRCQECGKWGALEYADKKIIGEKDTTERLTKQYKGGNGRIYDEYYNVPVHILTYRVYWKCKYCGQRVFSERNDRTENWNNSQKTKNYV